MEGGNASMYDYFFTFRSVTAATQASRALERAGITSLMVRTPGELRQMGCGYSLRVKERLLHEAQRVLSQEKIAYRRLFRRDADNRWQEVAL